MKNIGIIAIVANLYCVLCLAPDAEAHSNVALSVSGYPSIQTAIDSNPGKMVFVPPGDHVVSQPIRITAANSGMWGPGRIVQSNPDAVILEVDNAPGAQIRDVTLTRAAGRNETHEPALRVANCDDAIIANVKVLDNWSDIGAIFVEDSARVQVRDCVIRNYSRISVDDRTRRPSQPDFDNYGFAFNCINGTGLDFRNVAGALAEGNRIVERRLLPTPAIKAKYRLGKIIKKDAKKGRLISQAVWDGGFVNLWRQGAALHVDLSETSDFVQIIGNYIENSQQGLDVHADHVIVAENVVIDTPHGIKTMHGARNVIITANQFVRNDLFGIGMMQGTISHAAGEQSLAPVGPGFLPNGASARARGANVDGYSIIAGNIVSDFGRGMSHWIWPVGDSIGPAPIQLGARALPNTPPLRDVIIEANVVYDPGVDKVLVDGQPRSESPRYRFAVRIEPGAAAPRGLLFSDNQFAPGLDGVISNERARSRR